MHIFCIPAEEIMHQPPERCFILDLAVYICNRAFVIERQSQLHFSILDKGMSIVLVLFYIL